MTNRQLHYISGMVITVFTGFHLLNHLAALVSTAAHIDLMNNLRIVYRNIFVESALLIAVLVQIISGIRLYIVQRKKASGWFEKLHLWTGLYLALFFTAHISAIMIGRTLQHLDTNIYFGIAGLNTFPFMLIFIPYYFLAITSFFGHIACVHRIKMKSDILGITPHRQSVTILFLGILMTVLVFYGLTNGFRGEYLPPEYRLK